MEIYQELVFMFGRALDIEISNLNFSNFGGKTRLLRVYEKGNDNSVLTVNLDRMHVTRNSPRSIRLDEQVKDLLREFMETEYFKNKTAEPEQKPESSAAKKHSAAFLLDTLAQTVRTQAETIEELKEKNSFLSGFIRLKGLTSEYDSMFRE